MRPIRFMRLVRVQELCFTRGRYAWARALGQRIRETLADHPTLKTLL